MDRLLYPQRINARAVGGIASIAALVGVMLLATGPASAGEAPHPANVGIGKVATDDGGNLISAVDAGDSYRYRIVVFNNGDEPAEDVTVVDDLDDDLLVVSTFFDVDVSAPGGTGSCDVAAGNVITCEMGTLGPKNGTSDSGFVRIIVTAPESACGTVVNQASVSASNEPPEKEYDNISSEVSVEVRCEAPSESESASATASESASATASESASQPASVSASESASQSAEQSVQGATGTPAAGDLPDTSVGIGGEAPVAPIALVTILVASFAILLTVNLGWVRARR